MLVGLIPGAASASIAPVPADIRASIAPAWVNTPLADQRLNETALLRKETSYQDPSGLEFNHLLGGDKQALALRQQYEDMNRNYEVRENYSLLDPQETMDHANQVSQFSHDVMTRVRMEQVHNNSRLMRDAAMQSQSLSSVRQPIGVVAGLAAIYSGEPMKWDVTDKLHLRARTMVRDSRGELGLDSPLMNGRVEVATQMPDHYTPDDPRFADGSQANERVKLSLSKDLPLQISSGMSFGTSTGTMAASVSRPISEHVTCVVDSIRPMRSMDFPTPPSLQEERVKVLYGVSF
jgi:hypothetical protein